MKLKNSETIEPFFRSVSDSKESFLYGRDKIIWDLFIWSEKRSYENLVHCLFS